MGDPCPINKYNSDLYKEQTDDYVGHQNISTVTSQPQLCTLSASPRTHTGSPTVRENTRSAPVFVELFCL